MSKPSPTRAPQKIVIQSGKRCIKGYLESPAWAAADLARGAGVNAAMETVRVRLLESGKMEEIPVKNLKAVFYVKSFEGNPEHKVVNFYSRAPIPDGIWMRVEFRDGEVMEGIVLNTLHYLIDPGFFILPTAPDSNNELVYVVKSWLADHRVLGLRAAKLPRRPAAAARPPEPQKTRA